MRDMSSQIWSENHVVSADRVAQLKQAVDSFSASYTSGKNAAQDTAAWTALQVECE